MNITDNEQLQLMSQDVSKPKSQKFMIQPSYVNALN